MSASPASGASTTELEPDAPSVPGPPEASREQDLTFRIAAPLVLGGVLAVVVFGARGGTELTRTSLVEIFTVLLGAGVVVFALLRGPRGPLYGATSLVLFGALAILTALSVLWSIAPGDTYVEAGRTLAYLAVFGAALAGARIAPGAAPVVLKGIAVAALAAVGYALAARVWPDSIGTLELSNRIGQPFDYWNALAVTAAMAVPALLWLASRRSGSLIGRALAYPGLGAVLLALLLAQSRSALLAAVVGAVVWLAVVPDRLRALVPIVVAAVCVMPVAAWALSKEAFSEAGQTLAVKETVSGELGLLVGLLTVVLAIAGWAIEVAGQRWSPPPALRRRAGIAAIAAAGLVVLLGVGAVAASDRGLGGTISDRIDEFTSETETAPSDEGAARLTAASSTRGKYWREAGRVFDDRPSVGTGAGTFGVARLRHRTDETVTEHAHGFVPQTLADLGIVGVVLTTGLLLAWLVAAARTLGLRPRRLPLVPDDPPPGPMRGERAALLAVGLVALVFGLQSTVDWTWFVPGPAAMALVAAGFAAGRGPRAADATLALDRSRPSPAGWLAAAAVVTVALFAIWSIWQPEAADRDTGDALELADEGEIEAAIAKTVDAADANPLSPDPLLVRAGIEEDAGRETAAERTLEQAVLKFPGESETWYRLAAFQFATLDEPAQAASTMRGALFLDPLSKINRRLYLDALAEQRARAAVP